MGGSDFSKVPSIQHNKYTHPHTHKHVQPCGSPVSAYTVSQTVLWVKEKRERESGEERERGEMLIKIWGVACIAVGRGTARNGCDPLGREKKKAREKENSQRKENLGLKERKSEDKQTINR